MYVRFVTACRPPCDVRLGMPLIWSILQRRRVSSTPCATHKACGLNFGAFEKVECYEARHLIEMIVARQPNLVRFAFIGCAWSGTSGLGRVLHAFRT
jgi:hypothetical protein